ncbi:hypothetical protein RCH11_001076 [Glaciihabitans sp. GrIS 2.15]|nr:hypothetical protein [Glaciihabitans sp. GrIS 2.15]
MSTLVEHPDRFDSRVALQNPVVNQVETPLICAPIE